MVKVNITNLYGMGLESVAQIAQNEVAQIGRQLGFNELGIYYYNAEGEIAGELETRIDGINASLGVGDIVIFQLPTWNAVEFEQFYVAKLKAYGIKIIFFIQDIPPLMFKVNYRDWMQPEIRLYEQADLLILPSRNMADRLKQEGLKNKNIVYQNLWDHVTSYEPKYSKFQRKVNFLGNQDRFPFTKNWKYNTPLRLFNHAKPQVDAHNVEYMGYYSKDKLLEQLNHGFGLCWSENTPTQDEKTYSHLNASYKLSTYLAAGLPIIVNKGISCEEFVREHNLGIVLNDLAELDDIIAKVTEQQYFVMSNKVHRISYLLRNGYMTKSVLIEAIKQLMLDN